MNQNHEPKTVVVEYTIVDGEHEYSLNHTMQSDGSGEEEQAIQELAKYYTYTKAEEEKFIQDMKADGTAMTGCRAIKDVQIKELHTITVTVLGGVVQDITNIPEGVQVKLMDYDIECLTEDELQEKTELDENGERCFVSIWSE